MTASHALKLLGGLGLLASLIWVSADDRIVTGDAGSLNPPQSTREYTTIDQALGENLRQALARSAVLGLGTDERILGGVAPHHFPTALSVLADFYARLTRLEPPALIILVGPDHRSRAKAPIVTTDGRFATPFGVVRTDPDLITALVNQNIVALDRDVFDGEHSVGVHQPFVRWLFPETPVLPIVIHPHAGREEATRLGRELATAVPERTLIIGSVDFSHYLPADRARPLDRASAELLRHLTEESSALVLADSPQTLVAVTAFVRARGGNAFTIGTVANSADFTAMANITTGYITGWYMGQRSDVGDRKSDVRDQGPE